MNQATKNLLRDLLCADDGGQDERQEQRMIGDYVIVRCRDAGVHAGTLVSYNGREVVLRDSRRMWQWWAASGHTLSGCARFGINRDKSKIAPVVGVIVLLEACEIIMCTGDAQRSIHDAEIHNDA